MSLSNTSLAFLRDLKVGIDNVKVDGVLPPLTTVFLVGNGGSAAIAGHIANDLMKHGTDAYALIESAVLTCFSNDYGYEMVYSEQIRRHFREGSTLIAISSSGKSESIINAVRMAHSKQMRVIALSGFAANNPLRTMALGIKAYSLWVPSYNYGVVECAHLAVLHSIVNPGVP